MHLNPLLRKAAKRYNVNRFTNNPNSLNLYQYHYGNIYLHK